MLAVLIVATVLLVVFRIDKVSVNASPVALAEQGWRASFSSDLKPEAIQNGDLYITDADGQPVEVEMTLHDNGRMIEIPQISIGEYKLHIKREALKGDFFKSLSTEEFPFSVQEEIKTLSGKKELTAYFAQLLSIQRSYEQRGFFGGEESSATESSADSSGSAESGGGDYSTTNNQVEGVDEADLVKTDGSFIYSISESRVVISDVRNPDNMAVAEELTFSEEMYPQQLFLSGDTLIVLGSQYSTVPMDGQDSSFQPYMGMAAVYLYDISNPATPQLSRQFGTEGNLNGARLANGILYFVTNVYPDIWMMEEHPEMDMRPRTFDSNNGSEYEPLPYESLSILPGTMEGSYSIVSAIDVADPVKNDMKTEGFLGSSEQLYMTEEALYLTAFAYLPVTGIEGNSNADIAISVPQQANTGIFKFTLEGTAVQFAASSEVRGTLLNQFSMDEYNEHFRIATTEGSSWDETAPSKNHLFILDGSLKQVGSVEDLAKGERIYSARFMGDKAYMVTFKETDPLFVIDVSTPAAPKVLGELKIPGFSNYLHPLNENHLIGFGYDTKLIPVKGEEPRVVTGGMKISLFDVSDFSNRKEKDTEIIGGSGTYSPLQYDHKALFIEPKADLFGFPVIRYKGIDDFNVEFEAEGAMIYTITPDGITETASLMRESEMEYEDWETTVQRILYIEDTLFTVANSELTSYHLDNFELIETLSFD